MESFSRYNDVELVFLLKRSRKESERAFAEIYSRYSQRIYAYCLRVIGHNEDANDVFQDTFFHFYEKCKIEQIDNLPAFLLKIARNLCLNFKRSKKETLNIDDFNLYSTEPTVEDRELQQIIAHALGLLRFEYREAFVLRNYQQMSYQEISDLTEVTVTVVKNRVFRAKEKIKNILLPYLENMSK